MDYLMKNSFKFEGTNRFLRSTDCVQGHFIKYFQGRDSRTAELGNLELWSGDAHIWSTILEQSSFVRYFEGSP